MEAKQLSTRDLCMIGLWAAIISIMAQLTIPMPKGVPMTMQTFGITITAVALGAKKGGLATLIYVLLGMIGLPVFAGFSGGIGNVVGPTGGFILSFPIMAFVIGLGSNGKNKIFFVTMLVIGTLINYILGVIGFCGVTGSSIMDGIMACVIPFIPTTIIKAIVGSVIGLQIKTRMVKAAWN